MATGGREHQSHTLQGWNASRLRNSHRGPSSSGTLQGAGGAALSSSAASSTWMSKRGNAGIGILFCWTLLLPLPLLFFCLWKGQTRGYGIFFLVSPTGTNCRFVSLLAGHGGLLPRQRRRVRPPCGQPQRGWPLHHLHLLSQQRLGCQGSISNSPFKMLTY